MFSKKIIILHVNQSLNGTTKFFLTHGTMKKNLRVETDTCFINKNYFMRINLFVETRDPASKR